MVGTAGALGVGMAAAQAQSRAAGGGGPRLLMEGFDRVPGTDGVVAPVPVSRAARTGSKRSVRGRRVLWLGALAALVAVLLVEQAAWAFAATGGITEVKSFATKLTGYVTAVAASVAVLFMAVNGLRWTMSSGNPSRQAEARNGLVAAAAGLAIALSAGLIVSLIIAALQ